MKKITTIVLDIDGTLLNSDHKISSKTKDTLIEAQKKGIKLILASGRPSSGMVEFIKELKMDEYNGFFISTNGAVAIDCFTNEILFEQTLPIQISKDILNHVKKFKVKPMIFKDDYLYVNDVYDNMVNFGEKNININIIEHEARSNKFKLCEIDDLAAFIDFPLQKILLAGDQHYLQKNYLEIKAPFENQANGMFTAPVYFEFVNKDTDKAKALDIIANKLNIDKDNIIAFGNGQNDCSLIKYAGVGVAMENSVQELKDLADEITLSNDDDGIVYMLEKYL